MKTNFLVDFSLIGILLSVQACAQPPEKRSSDQTAKVPSREVAAAARPYFYWLNFNNEKVRIPWAMKPKRVTWSELPETRLRRTKSRAASPEHQHPQKKFVKNKEMKPAMQVKPPVIAQPKPDLPPDPPKKEIIHVSGVPMLFADMENVDNVTASIERPADYFPQIVLPRIHPWLSEGRGISRERVADRWAWMLHPLEPEVLREILSFTYPDSEPSGFELLQKRFWAEVGKRQREGYRVGFLEHDPVLPIAGLYTSESGPGTLLFDVFANIGTMKHEHRHALQRQQLKAHQQKPKLVDLSKSCVAQVGRFFGEIDSTNQELGDWVGVFDGIEVAPSWHQKKHGLEEDPFRMPQHLVLSGNLSYPEVASAWVNANECPVELMRAVSSIKLDAGAFKVGVLQFVTRLYALRMEHFHLWYDLNHLSANLDPEKKKARIRAIPDEAIALKAEIDQALAKEAADRPGRIRTILDALPQQIRKDLCFHATAFENLSTCGGGIAWN